MKRPKSLFKERRRSGIIKTETHRYDPNDEQYIATHEAAHAVSAIVLGFGLKSVDVKQRLLPDGATSVGFTEPDRKPGYEDIGGKGEVAVIPYLVQELTGPLAEERVNPRMYETTGWAGDFQNVRQMAAMAVCKAIDLGDGRAAITPDELRRNEGRSNALVESATHRADELVTRHWAAITRVAALLRERRELSGDEVGAIVNTG